MRTVQVIAERDGLIELAEQGRGFRIHPDAGAAPLAGSIFGPDVRFRRRVGHTIEAEGSTVRPRCRLAPFDGVRFEGASIKVGDTYLVDVLEDAEDDGGGYSRERYVYLEGSHAAAVEPGPPAGPGVWIPTWAAPAAPDQARAFLRVQAAAPAGAYAAFTAWLRRPGDATWVQAAEVVTGWGSDVTADAWAELALPLPGGFWFALTAGSYGANAPAAASTVYLGLEH